MLSDAIASESNPGKRNLGPLYAILAVTFLPMVLAYGVYYQRLLPSSETVNQGQLLEPPLAIAGLPLESEDGAWDWRAEERRWRLFVPVMESCDESCEQSLYVTRQVKIRLGKKAHRLERMLVVADGVAVDLSDHSDATLLRVKREDFNRWAAQSNLGNLLAAEPGYWLVDQEGFAMEYFFAEQAGGDLYKDLKRLLKYSYE